MKGDMMEFSTDMFHYGHGQFAQEACTLGIQPGYSPRVITLTNPKTSGKMQFFFHNTIYDATGEEVGGWLFKSKTGLTLYIWND